MKHPVIFCRTETKTNGPIHDIISLFTCAHSTVTYIYIYPRLVITIYDTIDQTNGVEHPLIDSDNVRMVVSWTVTITNGLLLQIDPN